MPRLTAAALRSRAEWDVDIEDGLTVRVRRIDLIQAYMQGFIPLPLMAALERLYKNSKLLQDSPMAILNASAEDKEQSLELLQRYACLAVIDPIFVMADDGHPDHCVISVLSTDQLLKIWQSGPAKPRAEVSAATATEFREPVEPPAGDPALPDGATLPPAPVDVSVASVIDALQYG